MLSSFEQLGPAFFPGIFSLLVFFSFFFLSHQQVEIVNELEEKSNESRASEVVDYKKQDRVNECETASPATGGKYGRLHGVLS